MCVCVCVCVCVCMPIYTCFLKDMCSDVNLDMRADIYVLEDLCSDVDVDVRTGICFTKKKTIVWHGGC